MNVKQQINLMIYIYIYYSILTDINLPIRKDKNRIHSDTCTSYLSINKHMGRDGLSNHA